MLRQGTSTELSKEGQGGTGAGTNSQKQMIEMEELRRELRDLKQSRGDDAERRSELFGRA